MYAKSDQVSRERIGHPYRSKLKQSKWMHLKKEQWCMIFLFVCFRAHLSCFLENVDDDCLTPRHASHQVAHSKGSNLQPQNEPEVTSLHSHLLNIIKCQYHPDEEIGARALWWTRACLPSPQGWQIVQMVSVVHGMLSLKKPLWSPLGK